MLKISNLKKHFGGVRAVDGCSFSLSAGRITGLIGPNGAGKSTVFNLISGILKPDQGEILFKKENIAGQKVEHISRLGISRLFQQSRLFGNLSVKENLLLALDTQDEKFWHNFFSHQKNSNFDQQIDDILEKVEMKQYRDKLARDLSFGQKRLVEIARAILNPHNLLMLDEPVAGVNPKLRQTITELLFDLKRQGETILLIEHDMNFTFGVSDEIIVMDEGRVIAQGTPEKVRNNKQVLEAYLN
jgi:branched-chain amino acid transport system ATP-binding protein